MAINTFSGGNPINSLQAAGKNAVINGGFDIWQRSTSTTTTTASYVSADRWATWISAGSGTLSQDTVNVPNDIRYGLKFTTSASNSSCNFYHTIETANTIPFVNKTVTLSAYLSGTSGLTLQMGLLYSTTTDAAFNTSFTTISAPSYTLTTTPTRYSFSVTVPSNAKTLQVFFGTGTIATSSNYVSITGVQLELGTTATTFSRAGGTIQGELAACQRYYQRNTFSSGNSPSTGYGLTMTTAILDVPFVSPVPMRVSPTAVDYANITAYTTLNGGFTGGTVSINLSSPMYTAVRYTHGSAVFTNNTVGYLYGTSGYIGLSAEL
jgi:hypothetical protein